MKTMKKTLKDMCRGRILVAKEVMMAMKAKVTFVSECKEDRPPKYHKGLINTSIFTR